MASSSNSDDDTALGRLLGDYPPDIGDLVQLVRRAIKNALPDASERVYIGWRGIGFHHPRAGYLCAIFPDFDEVRVGFEHGHRLHDPADRLDGSGRQVRYLRISEWDADVIAVLGDLIAQSVHLS